MLLRASVIWLPMQLLLLWGQVWVLRVSPGNPAAEAIVVMGTLAGLAMIAWYALPWVARYRPTSSVVPVAAVWTAATLFSQLVLAATSFGSWRMAAHAFTVGGLLNLGNLSMALMLALPLVAERRRQRPVGRSEQSAPVAEPPRKDLVVATAHSH